MATKKMTGNDVRVLREGLDMTTVQFGKLLGLGPSAVTRWESKKSRAVHMDPFAGRVAEIIVLQSRKLGKGKFGEIVGKALEHEHDLFALWRILSMAFGETVRVVRKVTGGKKGGKAAKVAKAAKAGKAVRPRVARKAAKLARVKRARVASTPRATRRAVRAKRTAKATPAKAKRARPSKRAAPAHTPAATSESKVTPSASKERTEAVAASPNGVTPQ